MLYVIGPDACKFPKNATWRWQRAHLEMHILVVLHNPSGFFFFWKFAYPRIPRYADYSQVLTWVYREKCGSRSPSVHPSFNTNRAQSSRSLVLGHFGPFGTVLGGRSPILGPLGPFLQGGKPILRRFGTKGGKPILGPFGTKLGVYWA